MVICHLEFPVTKRPSNGFKEETNYGGN
jgi:hypothetical protein